MTFPEAVHNDILWFDIPVEQGRIQRMHKMKDLGQFDQIFQSRRFVEARAFIIGLTEFLQTFSLYIRTDVKTGFSIPLQKDRPGKSGCEG